MKIFVNMIDDPTTKSFIPDYIREKLYSMGEVEFNDTDHRFAGEELAEHLPDKDVLITGWGQPLIKKEDLGSVKLIMHTGGSVGGIVDIGVFDTDVKVISGNAYYAESVAEGTLAYMLFALRDMAKYSNALSKEGKWLPTHTEGLLDQTVGIVSLGAISRRLIPMLSMFRVKLKVYSTSKDMEFAKKWNFEYTDLDDIFSTCKVISVHTAKCPETDNMINDHHFKLIQPGSIFINTSRGSVIDEQALIENLKENRFKAVIDVYQSEPLTAESGLVGLDNSMLFPHQGGPTFDRRKFITDFLLDDVKCFFEGKEMKNLITKEVAEKMTVI